MWRMSAMSAECMQLAGSAIIRFCTDMTGADMTGWAPLGWEGLGCFICTVAVCDNGTCTVELASTCLCVCGNYWAWMRTECYLSVRVLVACVD